MRRAGGSASWEGARILRFGGDAGPPAVGAYGNWAIGSAANSKIATEAGMSDPPWPLIVAKSAKMTPARIIPAGIFRMALLYSREPDNV